MIEVFNSSNEEGVSPVIGVILMVAITVALVALVTVTVFDIGGDVTESPDATFQLEADSGEVIATVLRNENVQSFKLQAPDGSTQDISGSVGSSGSLAKGAGSYSIIAVMSDGSEEVLTSKDFRNIDSPTTVTGIVSYNPPAEGVTVELVDGSDNVLDSDTTGSDGGYSLSGSADTLQLKVKGSSFDTSKSNIDLIDDAGISQSNIPSELMNGSGTPSDPYEVEYISDLQTIKYDLDEQYELVNNINATNTENWNNNNGFEPLGDSNSKFIGVFNGQNYTVENLFIDRSGSNNVGLFGYVDGGTVKNTGLKSLDINGSNDVGGLAGRNNGIVTHSYSTGNINADGDGVGGLVGDNGGGSVFNSYSTSSVSGDGRYTGGLVGDNFDGSITSSYAMGNVDGGENYAGGLVGDNYQGSVTDSYSTGIVSGNNNVKGLTDFGDIVDSYWDEEASTQESGGGTGLTTSEMQGDTADDTMSGLDFNGTWITVSDEYPVLDAFDKNEQINNR